jgi:hypothetical protein
MISMDKKYRTREGDEVRIYALDGGGTSPVHGAYKDPMGWVSCSWMQEGFKAILEGPYDLIEVKPRIQRTVWINIYEREDRPATKEEADQQAAKTRIACVKVEIDCEEGHGL